MNITKYIHFSDLPDVIQRGLQGWYEDEYNWKNSYMWMTTDELFDITDGSPKADAQIDEFYSKYNLDGGEIFLVLT